MPCPSGAMDFRLAQCHAINKQYTIFYRGGAGKYMEIRVVQCNINIEMWKLLHTETIIPQASGTSDMTPIKFSSVFLKEKGCLGKVLELTNLRGVSLIHSLLLLEACKLFCRHGWSYSPRGLVKDGTRCENGASKSRDMCIEGKCNVGSFLQYQLDTACCPLPSFES